MPVQLLHDKHGFGRARGQLPLRKPRVEDIIYQVNVVVPQNHHDAVTFHVLVIHEVVPCVEAHNLPSMGHHRSDVMDNVLLSPSFMNEIIPRFNHPSGCVMFHAQRSTSKQAVASLVLVKCMNESFEGCVQVS